MSKRLRRSWRPYGRTGRSTSTKSQRTPTASSSSGSLNRGRKSTWTAGGSGRFNLKSCIS
nr:MAG TPA: hypothetical protein [Caudoviricetes sp.]